jgi:membrane associated rhomboid family serine protease
VFPIHDENRPRKKPYVNYALLLINVVIFFFFYLQDINNLSDGIISLGAIPSYILRGERVWTLLTSMFMHADIMHLLGNMVYLWVFGDNIEDAFGHVKYLIFYLLGGLAASFSHIGSLLITLPSLGQVGLNIPSVGASGAISAILGAYLVLYPRAKIRTVVFYFFVQIISVPAFYYLGFWFLYQLMMGVYTLSGFLSGVAFWAHIGGFIGGVVMVMIFTKPSGRKVSITRKEPLTPFIVKPKVRTPFVDVRVEDNLVSITAELPGLEQKDIKLKVSEREIMIFVEKENARFFKRILLPTTVIPQVEKISYKNGVLSISLHKKMF